MDKGTKQDKGDSDSGGKLLFADRGIRTGGSRSIREQEGDRTVQAGI